MERFKFVLYRPLQLIPVLFGVSLVTFILVRSIPGDPVRVLLGPRARPDIIAAVREQYGLEEPLLLQYVYFVINLFQGEMGRSIIYRAPVLEVIAERLAPTLFLLAYALVLSVGVALLLGVTAARYRGRAQDHIIRLFCTVGLGLPAFWLGIILIMVFSVGLGWFPVSGYGETFLEHLHHLFLPALTVAIALAPVLTRNLRATLIEQSEADYVQAARARGMSERVLFLKHVLPNSLVPTVNLLGVTFSWLIGGTVLVESVFSIPGMGQLMVASIFSRDYLLIQGITLAFAMGIIITNFAVDIANAVLDPRIKM
ncbi:MAG: ABC transporter permease [Alphaproteobacteria bacterium]|nr:ABC transporter permease [Alphaproteobacteria bacterium]